MAARLLAGLDRAFARFLVVGALGFLVDTSGTLMLAKGLGASAWLARLPAFVAASWVTYACHRAWTFAGRGSSAPRSWFAYMTATGLGAGMNYAAYSGILLALGTSTAAILAGVVAGSIVGLGFNYWISSRLIFR